jgi:hypothetical protein
MRNLKAQEDERLKLVKDQVSAYRKDLEILNELQIGEPEKSSISRIALQIIFPEITIAPPVYSEPLLEWVQRTEGNILIQRFVGDSRAPSTWPYDARLYFAKFAFDECPATDSKEEIDLVILYWIEKVLAVVKKSEHFVPEFADLPPDWINGKPYNLKGKREELPSLYSEHKRVIESTPDYWDQKKSDERLDSAVAILASTWIRWIKGLRAYDGETYLEPVSDRLFVHDLFETIDAYGQLRAPESWPPPTDALICLMIQVLENDRHSPGNREKILGTAKKYIDHASKIVTNHLRTDSHVTNLVSNDVPNIDNTSERRYQQFDPRQRGETGRILP